MNGSRRWKYVALITAGGFGVRMGASRPKQYLDLQGIPILTRTALAFETHPEIEGIVVTAPAGQVDYCRTEILEKASLNKLIGVVAGGSTRQQSVLNGLRAVEGSEITAIHDGVRPFISHEVISRCLEAAENFGGSVACAKITETVKRRNGEFLETIPRDDLWLAHTPQAFRTRLIIEAHLKALADGFEGTDDSVLVERLGYPMAIVEDSKDNIKITIPDDLETAVKRLL
jgi:2-C-methyl-D-erythritol 4-phosphate cytidylyltransferase